MFSFSVTMIYRAEHFQIIKTSNGNNTGAAENSESQTSPLVHTFSRHIFWRSMGTRFVFNLLFLARNSDLLIKRRRKGRLNLTLCECVKTMYWYFTKQDFHIDNCYHCAKKPDFKISLVSVDVIFVDEIGGV